MEMGAGNVLRALALKAAAEAAAEATVKPKKVVGAPMVVDTGAEAGKQDTESQEPERHAAPAQPSQGLRAISRTGTTTPVPINYSLCLKGQLL